MPLLTQNVYGASDTRDLISKVTFTFTMQRHLIRLASAPLISSCLATFGWVRVRSTMQNLRRLGENSDLILSRLWTKVHKICRRCRKPLVLSNVLCRLSVSRFVQTIFTINSRSRRKTEQMQKFLAPIFFRKGRPQLFYGILLALPIIHRLVKFEFRLMISVCET